MLVILLAGMITWKLHLAAHWGNILKHFTFLDYDCWLLFENLKEHLPHIWIFNVISTSSDIHTFPCFLFLYIHIAYCCLTYFYLYGLFYFYFIYFLFILFLFFNLHPRTCLLILEKGKGRERERKRNMDVRNMNLFPLINAPTMDQTHNLSMCPGWESNTQSFSL